VTSNITSDNPRYFIFHPAEQTLPVTEVAGVFESIEN
jgi:hypothetical protein